MNWFYHDMFGKKQGPISDQELRFLIMQKKIVPDTVLETDTGHQGKAGQVPGLFQNNNSPFRKPNTKSGSNADPPPIPSHLNKTHQEPADPSGQKSFFCTNCGNAVAEQAVACMNCGAAPNMHHKFCRICGASLNPEQVICIKCGSAVTKKSSRGGGNGFFDNSPKSKLVAGLFALLLGGIGIHKYYLGSWGWGILYTVFAILTLGYGCIITGTISLIEGIMYLVISDEEFARKYSSETASPFRW